MCKFKKTLNRIKKKKKTLLSQSHLGYNLILIKKRKSYFRNHI